MTKLVVLLVLGFSSLAPAATLDIKSANAKNMVVDKDRGGGNAVNGKLFDFYENEGTEKVDVKKLPVYAQVLVPIFKKLDSKLPALSYYLTMALKEKSWYLEPKPLSAAGCVNSSMIKVQTTIIACQSPYEVRIDSNWLAASTTTPEQAAGLIMHELLVAKMMQPREYRNIREESVRYLNRLFFSSDIPEAFELQKILTDRDFERLPTMSESKRVKLEIQKELLAVCPTEAGKIRYADAYNFVGMFMNHSMSGVYSLAERNEFYEFGNNFFSKVPGYKGHSADVACSALHATVRTYDGKTYDSSLAY
jgi:hypothetical protein